MKAHNDKVTAREDQKDEVNVCSLKDKKKWHVNSRTFSFQYLNLFSTIKAC